MEEKGQLFVLVAVPIKKHRWNKGNKNSPLGKQYSNDYYRQEPLMAAKISRQNCDEKQDI